MGDDSIAIAGGGPVGLIAALAFGLDGHDVTVFEAEDAPSMAPRAIVYLNPLLPDLDRLGILADMKASGHVDHEGFNMHLVALGEVLSAPNTVLDGVLAHPYNVHLGQGDVCQIALDHLARLPGVDVRFGHRVTGLEQDGGGVTLTVGNHAGQRRHRAGWVIGADGGRSTVRELIGATADGMTWGERFVATNVYVDFRALGMKSSNMYAHPTLGAVIADIDGGGRWRVTFQEDASLPAETVRERIDAYFRALLPALDAPAATTCELDAFTPYRMHQRLSTKLRDGRVTLAGDAAHLTNPTGGLGLTGGIYDVIALHEGLSAVIGGQAGADVLDRYAAERSKTFTEVISPTASHLKNIVYGGHDAAALRDLTQQMREATRDVESQRAMLLGLDGVRSPSLVR